jgi:hypothetical protein
MPVIPDWARKTLCWIWAETSTAGWRESLSLEAEAGVKKVGEGTQTPFGGIRAAGEVIVEREVVADVDRDW